MKKLVVLLFLFLLFSCSVDKENDFVLMANGSNENYLIIVDDETYVSIEFSNKIIDENKLLAILDLKPNLFFGIDEKTEELVRKTIGEYKEDENSLSQTFVSNKKQLEKEIIYIFSNRLDLDITEFIDKIDKQSVYYFDDIEQIKDSANNLVKWLDQVKKLSTRKDL